LLVTQPGGRYSTYPIPFDRVEAEAYVDSLGGAYIDLKADLQPHWATAIGIPGHDGELARYTRLNVARSLKKCFLIRRDLTSFGEDSLSVSSWIDHQLLIAEITTHEYWFSGQVTWKRSPLPYADAIIEGIFSLVLRGKTDSLSVHLASRLKAIPGVVSDARANITDPILIHCEQASADLRSFAPLLTERGLRVTGVLDGIDAGLVTPELLAEAREAVLDLASFADSLAAGADSRYWLGEENYVDYLRRCHLIEESLEDMLASAEQSLAQAESRLEELGPREHERVLEPPLREKDRVREKQVGRCLDEIERAGLLTLAPGDGLLDMASMGAYARDLLLYMGPRQSEGEPRGALFHAITGKVGDFWGPMRWMERSTPTFYPAAHLLEVRTHGHASAVRRVLRSPIGREGWQAYFRQAALEAGVHGEDTPVEAREFWEEARYHAASAIAEIRIQTGEWTVDEAQAFLMEAPPDAARVYLDVSARRYAVAPGSGIGYLLGRREILRLRERLERVKRNSFDLKEFHDTLLSCGYLPPYLLSIEVMSKGMGRE
jgi:hypothetical protein